jgi:ribosomal protein S13
VHSQPLQALQDANALRCRKAEEKRRIGALTPPQGCEHAAAALQAREPWALACSTAELLTAVHGLGRNVAREICVSADIGLGVRFDSLAERTDTAIATIVGALRDRAANGPQQRRRKPSGPTDPDQVDEALRRGNEIRVARGNLRAELLALGDPAGRDRFCEILTTLTEHDALASMRLFDALGYIPGFGALKIQRVRDVTQIKGAFTLAGVARMRPRRRAWLLDVIADPWAHEPPTPLEHQPRPAPSAAAPAAVAFEPLRPRVMHFDAGALLAWIAELKPQLRGSDSAAVTRARAQGTISRRSLERLCVSLERPDAPHCLYPGW